MSHKQQPQQRGTRIGCWVLAAFVIAGGLVFGLAEAFGSSGAPTPFQQCVTSIQHQDTSTQVIGFTPQCMALPLDQRQAAIKQALGNG